MALSTIYPQRTNNILDNSSAEYDADIAENGGITRCTEYSNNAGQYALVRNLDNPAYMKILLDGKANLEELFCRVGLPLAGNTESQADTDRLLPGFRAIINYQLCPNR